MTFLTSLGGTDRHRGLIYDDGISVQMRGDFCGGRVNIFQVGVPVSSARGCAYRDKHEVGIANPVVKLGRKLQSARLYVAQYEIIQAGFIDGYYAIPQRPRPFFHLYQGK